MEHISIHETALSLVYEVHCDSRYSPAHPFDAANSESEDCLDFPEGWALYRTHVRHERSQGVVRLAKERFKETHQGALYCEVCGFSFDCYGEVGKDFIEAHHDVTPVSELGERGSTHVEDLRMTCSNCHRMLHRKRPWLTVRQLKELLFS